VNRVALFVGVVAVVVLAVSGYAVAEARRSTAVQHTAPHVAQAAPSAVPTGARIVFRHTGKDEEYGVVAEVPLDDPGGPRAFTGTSCDRVYATASTTSCLVTERGVVTRYRLDELDAQGDVEQSDALPGTPSRTRLSPDGSLVSTTTFVSGHSYMQVGFSTATEVRRVGGPSLGNLEKFQLLIDGKAVSPVDRNIWGVTFVDDHSFYATVGTGGTTYLVHGDLDARTLTAVRQNAECPSVSPDRTKVAYKVANPSGPHWSFAVLDLATGDQTVLRGETRSVDDQAEWLDDDTLLYGVPRADDPGVTDVWSLDTSASAKPELLIPEAWSPAVVRP
jgi:hypothetical protein